MKEMKQFPKNPKGREVTSALPPRGSGQTWKQSNTSPEEDVTHRGFSSVPGPLGTSLGTQLQALFQNFRHGWLIPQEQSLSPCHAVTTSQPHFLTRLLPTFQPARLSQDFIPWLARNFFLILSLNVFMIHMSF